MSRLQTGFRWKRRNSLRSNSLRFFSPEFGSPLFRLKTKAGFGRFSLVVLRSPMVFGRADPAPTFRVHSPFGILSGTDWMVMSFRYLGATSFSFLRIDFVVGAGSARPHSGWLLLFLLGVQKKKVTKRKAAGFRFESATNRFPVEAQELASLKQPALLLTGIRFFAFSPQN